MTLDDNIVNDRSLYGSDVPKSNRKNRFVSENRIGIFFSESECSSTQPLTCTEIATTSQSAVGENVPKSRI